MIRHGRHVPSQCPKQKHFPPVLVAIFNISGGDFLCLGHWLGTWRHDEYCMLVPPGNIAIVKEY